MLVGKALWARDLRYRKNDPKVFGKPDFTFKRLKIAVFCDSEFWHGKDWKQTRKRFKSNRDYWLAKIERNIQRDMEVNKRLRNEGWTVLRFWAKDLQKNLDVCVDQIIGTIATRRKEISFHA